MSSHLGKEMIWKEEGKRAHHEGEEVELCLEIYDPLACGEVKGVSLGMTIRRKNPEGVIWVSVPSVEAIWVPLSPKSLLGLKEALDNFFATHRLK